MTYPGPAPRSARTPTIAVTTPNKTAAIATARAGLLRCKFNSGSRRNPEVVPSWTLVTTEEAFGVFSALNDGIGRSVTAYCEYWLQPLAKESPQCAANFQQARRQRCDENHWPERGAPPACRQRDKG